MRISPGWARRFNSQITPIISDIPTINLSKLPYLDWPAPRERCETGTARTTWPGKVGYGGMDSLVRGVTEDVDKDEELLFRSESQIKTLIESLSKKEDK